MRRLALAALLACASGLAHAELPSLLADLPDDVLEKVGTGAAEDEPRELLARVFSAAPAYHFEAGLAGVDTDRRWFQTLPSDASGAPFLELRRWPGDTVLALYALEGASSAESGPTIQGATLSPIPGETGGARRYEGSLATSLGARPVAWLELPVQGVARRLGALLVPGDAGFGADAVPGLVQELLGVVGRIEVRTEAFELQAAVAAGTPLVAPEVDAPPGEADESRDAWQVVEGAAFTLGLPPGVRARRLDQGVVAPRALASSVLWLRGRFLDRRGVEVAIGDGTRAGYVAFLPLERAWTIGDKPPLGAPRGKRLASEDFTVACEASGAESARGERWSEPGFAGEWLVFRMVRKGAGIELGLPLLSGRRSEALFWIPTTLRGRGEAPAPPPVDPSERFGISYNEFTKLDRKRNPGFGGYLVVPGVRFELPSGWIPITTLRSADGFPVLLVAAGKTVGRLVRLAPDAPDTSAPEQAGWSALRKRGGRGGIYRRADGARLHVSADGTGVLLEHGEASVSRTEWERLVESATLLRPPPRKASRAEPREEASTAR